MNTPQEETGTVIASFLSRIISSTFDGPSVLKFLAALKTLPLPLPLLNDIYSFCAGNSGAAGEISGALERRYLKVKFVQKSLEKIDFKKAKHGENFDDFMFSQTDFSIYARFGEKEFETLFIKGPGDYPETFFSSALRMKRTDAEKIIAKMYKKTGGLYVLADTNPLALAVVRTLHTSLDFAPLFSRDRILEELKSMIDFFVRHKIVNESFLPLVEEKADELFLSVASLFHGRVSTHSGGEAARVFMAPVRGTAALCATFSPDQKPHTLTLVPTEFSAAGLCPASAPPGDFTPFPGSRLLRDTRKKLIFAD